MPPAAILDVDGTLVDTNYHHAIAWLRAFRQNEVVLPIWRIHRHIGMEDLKTTSVDVEATKPEPDLVVAAVEKAGGGFSEAELRESLDETPLAAS
jgi:beta-phosphoglucomutase-like phosphatase (HAD superfamily)